MAGRRSLKSDAVKRTTVDAYARGGSLSIAARVAGISVDSLTRWRDEDSTFAEALEQARAQKAHEYLKLLDSPEHRDAKQMRWFLGTMFASDYSQQKRIELTGAGGGPVRVDNIAELVLHDPDTGEALNGLLNALGAAARANRKNESSGPLVGGNARLDDAVDSRSPSRPTRLRDP